MKGEASAKQFVGRKAVFDFSLADCCTVKSSRASLDGRFQENQFVYYAQMPGTKVYHPFQREMIELSTMS
jgi:hypothetical protein